MDETSAPTRPFFDRVESARATAGWTKTKLSEMAGVSRVTIDRWRDQKRSPLPESVTKVADALGIDRTEALRLAGIIGSDPTAPVDHDQVVAELRDKLAAVNAETAAIQRRLAELEGRNKRPKTG